MNEFLQPTAIIDCTAAPIVAAAAEIAGDATDDEEIARRCFLWVRDSVRHSVDHRISVVTCTASDVLEHRAGFCYAKSHLLVALLRARGIPAALCYQRLSLDSTGSAFICTAWLPSTFSSMVGIALIRVATSRASLQTFARQRSVSPLRPSCRGRWMLRGASPMPCRAWFRPLTNGRRLMRCE